MNKRIVVIGVALIIVAIILGAFGAHGLKKIVDVEGLKSFDTGVRYQMYQGVGLFIIGLNSEKLGDLKWVWRFHLIGVLLFSVSIYFLVLQDYLGVSMKFLGPITPIGGVLMIVGWGILLKNLLFNK
jgi:uncharacterized membrane protein YgdD (TMEM256/DUF423 family)